MRFNSGHNTCLGCLKRTTGGRICIDCGGDAVLIEKRDIMLTFEFGDNTGVPDEPYDIWVTHYNNQGYEGDGEAVGIKVKDGLVDIYNLFHCSCNDPLDYPNDTITLDKFTTDAMTTVSDDVYQKCMELLDEYKRTNQSSNQCYIENL